jgi:hypothetical protein
MSRGSYALNARTPAKQLADFLGKFDPMVAALARGTLSKLRNRLPGAFELVYDNYNALAIAFSPTDTSSAAVFSIAVYPRWVSLFFSQGARLRDPNSMLKGSGNQMRHIVLANSDDIQRPEVEALISEALKLAGNPIDARGRRRLIIKSIAAKQRPRRPISTH